MTSIAYVSSGPTSLSRFCDRAKGAAFSHDRALLSIKGRFAFRPCLNAVFFGCSGSGWRRRKSDSAAAAAAYTTSRTIRPVMEWQECSSEIEVDVPCSVAYDCYSDRESIPKWMPFISSVKVLKDKPELSRWALKYEVFGRDVEFSWLARNMQPTPNQKIHWRSLEGLPNRGAVRFFPKGPSACRVQLTVSYEVPEILAPVASALKPFLEGLLVRGLEQFAVVAKQYQKKAPQS